MWSSTMWLLLKYSLRSTSNCYILIYIQSLKEKKTNKQKTTTEYLAFYQLICSGQNGIQKTKRVVLGRLPAWENQ